MRKRKKKKQTHLIKSILATLIVLFSLIAAVTLTLETTLLGYKAQTSSQPNVLMILADDLGYPDLGTYGNTFIKTPNIDNLAKQGMQFQDFYTNGVNCSPTRASILSGQFPSRHGLRYVCGQATQIGLSEDTKLLPQYMKEAGYATYHVGKWHLGSSSDLSGRYAPNAKGYDYFFGFLFQPELPGPGGGQSYYNNPMLKVNTGNYERRSGHLTSLLASDVMRILEESDPTKPFFITYWPLAPHSPDQPPAEWAQAYPDTVEGRYAANVSSLDENVGKILAKLDATGKSNNTVVMFLSDNGGTIGQHPNGVGDLRGSKHTTFEGGIKVPMIIRWPGQVAPGSKNRNIVMSMDIFPTIAEIVGLNTSEALIDGQSFLSLLKGNRDFPDRQLFWEHKAPGDTIEYAVRDKRWKYIIDTKGNNRKYLFNINQDPGETTNLFDQYPNVVDQLQKAYEDWRWRTAEVKYDIRQTKGNTQISGNTYTFGKDYGYVQIPNNSRFNPDIFSFTINMWLKPTEESDSPRRLVSKGQVWRTFLSRNDKISFMGMSNSDSKLFVLQSNGTIPKNQWTHVAITMEFSGDIKIYLNGKLDTSMTYVPIRADRRVLDIGNSRALNQPFYGNISNLKFFNDALTEEEVVELYNTTRPQF